MTTNQPELDFTAPDPAPLAFAPSPSLLPIDPAFNRLVDYLRAHNRSPAEAISASNLAIFLDIGPRDGRQVRRLISLYRDRAPVIILGESGRGFYIASDPAEQCTHARAVLYANIHANALAIRNLDRLCRRHGLTRIGAGPTARYSATSEGRINAGSRPA